MQEATERIELIWARRPPDDRVCNFGDALSPIVTALISGQKIQPHTGGGEKLMSAIGTIGHAIERDFAYPTVVNMWGTGIDATIDPRGEVNYFRVYQPGVLRPAVTRGAFTEMILRQNGVKTTGVYGDPGWLMRRVLLGDVKKKYDIGVVLHLSELAEVARDMSPHMPKYLRYNTDPGDSVKIISTLAERTVGGVIDKINEIRACRMILAVSLHGIVIAEAFGIPCAHFHFIGAKGVDMAPTFGFDSTRPIDHRFRDFYSGIHRRNHVLCYRWPRVERIDYSKVYDEVHKYWEPVVFDDTRMIEAFPFSSRSSFPAVGLESVEELIDVL